MYLKGRILRLTGVKPSSIPTVNKKQNTTQKGSVSVHNPRFQFFIAEKPRQQELKSASPSTSTVSSREKRMHNTWVLLVVGWLSLSQLLQDPNHPNLGNVTSHSRPAFPISASVIKTVPDRTLGQPDLDSSSQRRSSQVISRFVSSWQKQPSHLLRNHGRKKY